MCRGWLFFFNLKTAYVLRISDCSADVGTSDLVGTTGHQQFHGGAPDAAATTRHDYRLAAQIRHLSLQQFLIGVPVSLLELEAHGHAIFVGDCKDTGLC